MQSIHNYYELFYLLLFILSLQNLEYILQLLHILIRTVRILSAQQARVVMAAELGSMGLWALTDTVIEVGLDNAFFPLKIIYLYMCLMLLITSNLFLIPNSS